MHTKLALMMDLPEGKIPGFYAQIVKSLGNQVQLFDRDKEMLIVNTEEDRQIILDIMSHYKVASESLELLLLPREANLTDTFSDYGFLSKLDNTYLYMDKISLFRFNTERRGTPEAELSQALLQLEEHLIAYFSEKEEVIYVIDKQLTELAEGIARAYQCEIIWI
ncbi:hypothetical protein [Paenibacillus eucommiae]|uniref:Uncharacterized protein n=1 Tax=Paenibacillus eucommiae TaxID=1355755 RepID=A0ABS4J102_9BACL|nr:hypothetical protein [Paenibacillus eucommiae]MBP1992816.1 hypothetical protein [Paenibacillus eucommiae]